MAYAKQNWINGAVGNTPLNAIRMNYMEDGILDASETADEALAAVANVKNAFVNVLDYGADPSGLVDSTLALNSVLSGAQGKNIFMPPGAYKVGGTAFANGTSMLLMGPDITLEAYGATINVADGAVKRTGYSNVLSTNSGVNNGTITIRGLKINGNDEGQFPESEDNTTAYNRSAGMVMSNGYRLNLIDVEIRHTRGHGINHWNWDYLFVRGYHVMQMVNPVAPSGARRRDGITGSSKHIDIEGVTGYTADDLVAVGVGIQWSPLGIGGAIDTQTVNIRGISPQVADTNSNIKAWRAVAVYAMNGGTFNSVVISGVTGETKSGHVMFKCYADAGDTGPNVNKGYVKTAVVSDVSGLTQSFSEFETFMSVSQMTIDNLVLSNFSRRLRSVEQGSTSVPITPTILIRNGATIGTLMLSAISCVQEDTGNGRDVDLILIRDALTTVERIVTNGGSLSLTQPYATTPGSLMLLRKSAANSTPTLISGIQRQQIAIENAAVVNAGVSSGQGVDADQLTATGIYLNSIAAANWPITTATGPQLMMVGRDSFGTVMQTVFRDRNDLARAYTRTRTSNVWSSWQTALNPDVTTWRNGVSTAAAAISPETLANVIKYVTGYQVSGAAGNGTDANLLVRSGVYATVTASSANWPYSSGSMQMIVTPLSTGEILQTVVRLSSGNQSMLSFRSYNGTAWSSWTSLNAHDILTWKGSTSTLYSMISPLNLSDTINQGGSTGSRPTGANRPLYIKYFDTTLGKLITWDGTNWRDPSGANV